MSLTEDEYRALVEQAHQVYELTQHPGWEVFLDYLRFSDGALAARQVQLLKGAARTWEDYQHRTGFIAGVQYAIDAPERLEQQRTNAAKMVAATQEDE